jgi:hypothetical protein
MRPQGLIHEAELIQAPIDMQLPTTNGASYEYGISAELMHVSVGDVDHALRYHPAVSAAAQQSRRSDSCRAAYSLLAQTKGVMLLQTNVVIGRPRVPHSLFRQFIAPLPCCVRRDSICNAV